MKIMMTLGALLVCSLSFGQQDGNYIVIINSDSVQINLDTAYQYKTSSGEDLVIKVVQPNVLTYTDSMISFQYDKSLSVSDTEIGEGIEQCMVISASGNGFLVQKYKTIDPSSLTQLMLNEITKQNVSYGYVKTEKKFKKKLLSGQTIEGIEATLTYKGEKEVYTVATYGGRDEGIIVVTMLLIEDTKAKQIIDLFLNTLKIKG